MKSAKDEIFQYLKENLSKSYEIIKTPNMNRCPLVLAQCAVILQTIINELLEGTVPLDSHLPKLLQKKIRNHQWWLQIFPWLIAYPCLL